MNYLIYLSVTPGNQTTDVKPVTLTNPNIEVSLATRIGEAINDQSAAFFLGVLVGFWVVIVRIKLTEKLDYIVDILKDIEKELK